MISCKFPEIAQSQGAIYGQMSCMVQAASVVVAALWLKQFDNFIDCPIMRYFTDFALSRPISSDVLSVKIAS